VTLLHYTEDLGLPMESRGLPIGVGR
jgi:hypothetical protein